VLAKGDSSSRVVIVGSMNLDLSVEVDSIVKPGETIIGRSIKEFPGGKGSNQAASAAKFGAQVAIIARVGRDSFGNDLLNHARDLIIDVSHVGVDSEMRTGLALITVSETGENSIVVVPGANMRLSAESVIADLEQLGPFDVLSTCLEIPFETTHACLEYAKLKKIDTVLNLSPYSYESKELISYTDYLIVNEHEICQLTQCEQDDLVGIKSQLRDLGAKNVVITKGREGAMLFNCQSDLVIDVTAPEVIVKDTTGCGDAFAGVFAAEIGRGESVESALKLAVFAGSFAATGFGAQSSYGTRSEIMSLIHSQEQPS
jgi:ribokinase